MNQYFCLQKKAFFSLYLLALQGITFSCNTLSLFPCCFTRPSLLILCKAHICFIWKVAISHMLKIHIRTQKKAPKDYPESACSVLMQIFSGPWLAPKLHRHVLTFLSTFQRQYFIIFERVFRRGNAFVSPKKASLSISRVSYLHGPVLEGRENWQVVQWNQAKMELKDNQRQWLLSLPSTRLSQQKCTIKSLDLQNIPKHAEFSILLIWSFIWVSRGDITQRRIIHYVTPSIARHRGSCL